MALLARGLSQEKYEVHLGLVRQAHGSGESLPPWVSVDALNAGRARAAAFPLLRLIWRLRPAVVLSGAAEVSLLVLMLRPLLPRKTSVLVRQNATASSVLAFGSLPRFTRLIYRLLYRHSDHVICQSQAMAKDLAVAAGIGEELIAVLPNPVDLEGIRAAMRAPVVRSSSKPQLLAVGRLSPEKGFDLLLKAMVTVRERFPEVSLILAGAGQEETALKSLSSELGLETAVRFRRATKGCPMPCWKPPRPACLLWPLRHPEALLICCAGGLARGWPRKSPRRHWLWRSLRRLKQFGPAKGLARSSSLLLHRMRSRRLWKSASGDRTLVHPLGAKVINSPVFPVEINLLTFFLIGCFLWVQIQSSFPHPKRTLLPGSLSRCPGKLAQTKKNRACRANVS
jgi:glycosyltransferase involved in cell wall biosynthesis